MSATNQFEDDLLDLVVTNVDAPFVGDATGLQGAGTAGSLQISLHTVTMLDTDLDTTNNEAAYTSYVRRVVARALADWTVASGQVDNDNQLDFVTATGGSETELDFGITLRATGDYLHLFGALDSSLAVSNGITPSFAAQALAITLD